MKNNRISVCLLTAFMVITLLVGNNLKAQVTIGGDKKPEKFSMLELISNKKTGLRMPLLSTIERDKLENTTEFQNKKDDLARGLTIYNTTTDCLEFWNGAKWVSACEGDLSSIEPAPEDANAKVESCIPYMFTYQMMDLTASHSTGTPSTYQWVVDGKAVAGATGSTYTYVPPADIELTTDILGNQLKEVTVVCRMEIGGVLKQTPPYNITVVKADKGVLSPIYVNAWKKGINGTTGIGDPDNDADLITVAFAHVNLGAENSIDPCDCLGDLYQWGRPKDGHQLGTSSTTSTQSTVAPPGHADFITGFGNWLSSDVAELWGDDGSADYNVSKNTINDPCPVGWKVPSQKQWGALLLGETANVSNPATSSSLANKWDKVGAFVNSKSIISGYKLADALLLVAGGRRNHDASGTIADFGSYGYYWSSTADKSLGSHYMYLLSNDVYPAGFNGDRAYGHSIRCIKD